MTTDNREAARELLPALALDDALAELAAQLTATAPDGVSIDFVERAAFGRTTQVERFRLSNGLQVLLSVDRSAPVLAYHTWFNVGSRHERPGKTGIAHLFEHMMFKGTENMPAGEFDRVMEAAGASTNAATWVDWTYYRANLPKQALELVVRLEADRMCNLVLDEDQLESERAVVMNERNLRVENDPEGKQFEELYYLAFGDHPYGAPTIGWMDDIRGLSLEDCRSFYRHYYAPNNATVVIVGDLDRSEALGLLLKHLGPMASQTVPTEPAVPEEQQDAERRLDLKLSVHAPRIAIAYKSPSVLGDDLPALELANEVLFNGESARLHRRLVLEEELATGVTGWASTFALPGLYEVFVSLKDDADPEQVEGIIYEEIDRLGREGPTAKELEKARNKLETDHLRGGLAVGSRARNIGNYETSAGDFRVYLRHAETYPRLTADDAREAIARYARPERRTVVRVFPLEEAAGGGGEQEVAS